MMNELVDVFQSFKRILCICPCCGEMMCLNDLYLKYAGKAPKNWFDIHKSKVLLIQKKEEIFEEKESEMREKSIERGRKKVPLIVRRCLCTEFKGLKYDPYDIKALMHPVDFIIFDGLNKGDNVKNITFLSRKSIIREQNIILKTIKETIDKNNYDWKVARISIDGNVGFE
jgi:predicted Holliday junction resolvase-like endonuclease